MKRFAWIVPIATLAYTTLWTAGCGDVNAALSRVIESQQRSSDLLVQFTKAADASTRAVMADTDERSAAFAREADGATSRVQQDIDALRPILTELGYTAESSLLEAFATRFAEYRALDRRILDLAVENSNLKARGLSFGPVQEAAETFRRALEDATSPAGADAWQAKALAASAVSAVREIQVLQAPHIAEPDDDAMTRIERNMTASEETARRALASLAPLVRPAGRSKLTDATAALDHFMDLHKQLLAMSRRNTNVRSLALTLDQKQKLVAPCEESLRALQAALAKRGPPTRH